jgi:aminomethyltransferase
LAAERDRGVARHLVGLALAGRQPPRQHCAVRVDGEAAGEITSGNFSPVLGHGIALALLPPAVGAGAGVEIEVRDRRLPATVTATPFVTKHKA